jgi:hypothetical protein
VLLPTIQAQREIVASYSGAVYSGPKKLDHDFESNPW